MLMLLFCSTSYSNVAIFAGGCFWCTQADFISLKGVINTVVGFDGGVIKNPTYNKVAGGRTKYVESVLIEFDPAIISYQELIKYFLRTINLVQKNGQFCDIGPQYRSVIFYVNIQQQKIAQQELSEISMVFPSVQTEILASTNFYSAEEYHQNYANKNPIRYAFYRWQCGRDKSIKKLWSGKKK